MYNFLSPLIRMVGARQPKADMLPTFPNGGFDELTVPNPCPKFACTNVDSLAENT